MDVYPEEIRVLAKLCGLARDELSCAHTALILPRGEEREDFFLQIEGQFNPRSFFLECAHVFAVLGFSRD
jgi:hypothetical protein